MASSIATSLFRRSLRVHISSSSLLRQRRSLFTPSFIAASSSATTQQDLKPAPSRLFPRFASSKVSGDENLKRVLDSEIQCLQQSDNNDQEVEVPEHFPFDIVDTPGDQALILKREFSGENIQVTVLMNFDEQNDMEENDEDDEDDDKNENSMEPTLSLVVAIDKGEGPLLEFCCNLNADKLEIESMTLKKRDNLDDQSAYQGPEFLDLDENLQKSLHKYLEVRGIKSSQFDFLHEYMLNKDEREYLVWLKNMKEFIA
ncbi:hypothetical protein Cni_G02853 [Canna indica]|uniref:Mitochondrial glycoprotein n=1 Tax=Canna indica TaxID=4628 RepID=A0AAQ3JSU5_9LILI|nr:hypothetical protein Cni_G02853 [Canna indica]